MLRVEVADTGIGIGAEHLGMLFEAFRQVDGSARRIYEGTGLGLYLCRKLLTLMGGEIHAESEHGKGSRFLYSMPLKLAAGPG
jgi:signal transduction histidine kinase